MRPEDVAVVGANRAFTYGELDEYATRIASWLRKRGARPNSLVAVVMEKGWEQVAAVLGILRSGAAYLPVDASLPTERLCYLLDHGHIALVLTQLVVDGRVPWPDAVERLCVDADIPNDSAGSNDTGLHGPEDLAYVIYTSGSTGFPKGVMIDHRGAVNTVLDVNRRFGIGPGDRVLALSSLSFDLSVYDIFGLLAAGGTIVLPDAATGQDPARWAELLHREQITVWNSVPALMSLLIGAGNADVVFPPCLRLVLLSGDWIPLSLPLRLLASSQLLRVISLGGATEASIWSVIYPIESVDPSWTSIPYGRPLTNQRLHVYNSALEPCPVWTTGQLYIAGAGLARGYWRDPDRTNASFITHPHSGERLYATGDLARYKPDGTIEFLGRDDTQVKIRGHRIELGEIEATLVRHEDVADAIVVVDGTTEANRRLIAHVILRPTASVTMQELQRYLRDRIPKYMVPTHIFPLDRLPLSRNGKVDRHRLVVPAQAARRPEAASGTVNTTLESTIARIWHEVVGGPPNPDVEANFFDLGATSAELIELLTKLRATESANLEIVDLFTYPTIRTLSAHLANIICNARDRTIDERASRQRTANRNMARRTRGSRQ